MNQLEFDPTEYEKNLELIEFFREQGPFSLLGLPKELISHTFSFLPVEDRMNVRVNKTLNEIEAESKCFMEELEILELPIDTSFESLFSGQHRIIFYEGRSYSTDCLRKIARDASIGSLTISLSGSDAFHREVYNLIKDFDIRDLRLRFENDEMEKEILVDSYFLEIVKTCKNLDIIRMDNVTAEALHHVYKNVLMGVGKLRTLFCIHIKNDMCISFLRLIGITFRDGQFFSNRMDIEVYENRHYSVFIYDGLLELRFSSSPDAETIFDGERGGFIMVTHENLESVEKWKKQFGQVKSEIGPE